MPIQRHIYFFGRSTLEAIVVHFLWRNDLKMEKSSSLRTRNAFKEMFSALLEVLTK